MDKYAFKEGFIVAGKRHNVEITANPVNLRRAETIALCVRNNDGTVTDLIEMGREQAQTVIKVMQKLLDKE